MTRIIGGLIVLAFLASCGADGMPATPSSIAVEERDGGPTMS